HVQRRPRGQRAHHHLRADPRRIPERDRDALGGHRRQHRTRSARVQPHVSAIVALLWLARLPCLPVELGAVPPAADPPPPVIVAPPPPAAQAPPRPPPLPA